MRSSFRRRSAPAFRWPNLRFEQLEQRALLATLGLGIVVREDVSGSPGPRTETLLVGQAFWVDVVIEDQRAGGAPQGVIGLPLSLSWDSDEITLQAPDPNTFSQFTPLGLSPTQAPDRHLLTPLDAPSNGSVTAFPFTRFVDAIDVAAGHTGFNEAAAAPPTVTPPASPTISNLRGGSVPAAPAAGGIALGVADATGAYQGVFSRLKFVANRAVQDTPFTMDVAGSVSFADTDPLDGVAALSSSQIQNRPPNMRSPNVNTNALAVTEFITIGVIPPPNVERGNSLSGRVYLDKNANGQYDSGEQGLPNVSVALTGTDTAGSGVGRVTTTGADGLYTFLGLAPGTYRIAETQPDPTFFIDAAESLGQLVAPPGAALTGNAGRIAGNDVFADIALADGEHGVDYNFGELYRPNKRMFLASTDPFREVCRAVDLNCVTVRGTDQNDQITVRPRDQVTIQTGAAAPQTLDIRAFDAILVDGSEGQDSVTVEGTNQNEVICVAPSHASVRLGDDYLGANYGVATKNVEDAVVLAGLGDDTVIFKDSTGADRVTAGGGTPAQQDVVEFTSGGGTLATARVEGINTVQAVSQRGGVDRSVTRPPISFELLLLGDFLT